MNSQSEASPNRVHARIFIAAIGIFLIAYGVRVLMRQDAQVEAVKVQSEVVAEYQRAARLIDDLGIAGLLDPDGPLADANLLAHPMGYPIVRAVIARIVGHSNNAMQVFQISCDSFAAVIVFLIAFELFSLAVASISGLLVALAPQFAWNSILLLPDTLSVLPILAAIWLLVRALRNPRVIYFIAVGVLIGLSCWLRANAMLLAPFVAVAAAVLVKGRKRFGLAGTLLVSAVVTIGVLTARNWIVYHHFIPVSLGGGQTLVEGIGDYDPNMRFGLPNTDMRLMKMEAEEQNRPDYYSTLFIPDGIQRDRARLARGFKVIANNPAWFSTVMMRRAVMMLRLERTHIVNSVPPFSRSFARIDAQVSSFDPTGALAVDVEERASALQLTPFQDDGYVRIITDDSKYGTQLRWKARSVKPYHDYSLRVPVRIEQGRVFIQVVGTNSNRIYTFAILEPFETKDGIQPILVVERPFSSFSDSSINVIVKNGSASSGRSVVDVGAINVYEWGPTSFTWTRYP